MSETLYRKYRPKNFSEIIGQEHIVRTLSNSIKNNRIGHAYLLTGPRGTGKTSIARILAKTINCEKLDKTIPCEKCPSCKIITEGKSLDIIEIDAASNTGVDNIRELRETVSLANSLLKYKVYIIDEAHMLSKGAFNALLKTLEEPPAHVVFILATTEIHKVPETILSRCQRFDFARLPFEHIIEKLNLIAKSEKVKIEEEALEMIALTAEGGMRDAESILGQIISLEDKNITLKEVEEILGTADKKTASEIAEMIVKKDSTSAISKINKLLEDGYDLQVFNKSLVNYLRQLMLVKISPDLRKHFAFELPEEQIKKMIALSEIAELPNIISAINLFLEAQNKISSFILPQLPLEIAIIKATHTFPAQIVQSEDNSKFKIQNSKLQPKIQNLENLTAKQSDNSKVEEQKKPAEKNLSDKDLDIFDVNTNWKKLLIEIRPYNHSLSALLCNCQPIKTEKNILTLATPYDFYREKLNEPKNKLTVEEVFSKILESNIFINIELDKSLILKKECASVEKEIPSEQDSLLDNAIEIMGGKVVEE